MKYENALKIVEKNQHLIGLNYKGARIDEIIIYPKKEKSLDIFLKLYLQSLNYKESIAKFLNEEEFHVAIICNKGMIDKAGWFAPIDIENINEAILNLD